MKILLTGATGFVGRNLLPRLLADGHVVRCLARSESSATKLPTSDVEIAIGDASDPVSIRAALDGCDSAYYLIHSMDGDDDYRQKDRDCAKIFAEAAAHANLQSIVYLSGLANEDSELLSDHLASRLEVGRILRGGSVPCVELRAAMIIGKNSLSFKMVEQLCKRLPIMICPKWLSTQTQPIGILDLLDYLVASLSIAQDGSRTIEIGGANQTTYLNILKEYCRLTGLKRLMIPVPILSPTLSGYWLGLITPETAQIGKAMIEGLRNPTYVRDDLARKLFNVDPMSTSEAIRYAIGEPTTRDKAPMEVKEKSSMNAAKKANQ
jgi:uncharacterized protein YbjT (DUF2867 family)